MNIAKKRVQKDLGVSYTVFNQKITFDILKSHLWSAADILRGSLDPGEYRQPIMTLLFLKRLNDSFEENAEKLIKQGKSKNEAYENKMYTRLRISRSGLGKDTRYLPVPV